MEKMTTLYEKTRTQAGILKESTARANNQNVLDKFSENENGELLYNGESVGGRKVKTVSYEFGDFGFTTFGDYGDELYVYDDNIPYGTEIKTVRFLYEDKWVDIRNIVDIDQMPYTLNMGVVYSSTMGKKSLAQIGATIAQSNGKVVFFRNIIVQATDEFNVMEIEVDYYEN